MSTTPSEILRRKWLDALLPDVVFDGWSDAVATRAAEAAGLTPGEQALAAPGGVRDLIGAFFDKAAEVAAATLEETDMAGQRTPERVKTALLAWLDALEPDREAVRRATQRAYFPTEASAALARTWKTADFAWIAAGDTSEDYNYYTKRGLLAAIVPSIIYYWLDNPTRADLEDKIDERLAQASGLGRNLGRIAKPLLDLLPVNGPNRT